MRLTAVFTAIGAFTALTAATSPVAVNNGESLHLLTSRKRSVDNNNVHGDPMRSKRQHGKPASSGLKKKAKRASGYCKAKTSTSSSSKANAVVTPASSSKQANSTPASSSRQQQASSSSSAAPAATSSASSSDDSDSGSSSGSGTANAQLGSISAFQGTNSGIMSWFRTNAGSDSTNGESWCQTKYQVRPLFSPEGVMFLATLSAFCSSQCASVVRKTPENA